VSRELAVLLFGGTDDRRVRASHSQGGILHDYLAESAWSGQVSGFVVKGFLAPMVDRAYSGCFQAYFRSLEL